MAYAVKDDIDNLYGVDLLKRIADRDRDGEPDPEVVQAGLAAADAIIDAYLQAQYTLPLPLVPAVLRDCAVDIAVYKIPIERTARTEEMRIRYEDALKMLDKIASGRIGLGVPPGTDADGDGIPDPIGGGVVGRKGKILNTARG